LSPTSPVLCITTRLQKFRLISKGVGKTRQVNTDCLFFLVFGLFVFHMTLEYSVLRGHVADVPVITGMVPMSSFIITRNSSSPKETATMRVLYSQSPP
jgi:hypothetical protein